VNNKDLFLILTSSSKIESADAVILLEGDGYSRILKATSLITEGWSDLLVFSGGIDNESVGSFTFEKCKSHLLNSGIGMDKIIHESNSQNTREQAVQVIKLCSDNGWKKIILVASLYHQFRAFLTFLKVLEENNLQNIIHIINSPAILEWQEVTYSNYNRLDLLKIEFEKIEEYSAKSHVSTYDSAINYYLFWSKNSTNDTK
jgi:hypothetical protein